MCNKRIKLVEASINANGGVSSIYGASQDIKPTHYLGAHVSAAGGLWNAFENCRKTGGNAFAVFLKNQRKWESPPISPTDVEKFHEAVREHKFDPSKIVPHGSYLVNLGNPDELKRQKSYSTFLDDLERCSSLGIPIYNLHPGSTVGACTVEESVKLIAECINRAHKAVEKVSVVLETMAGQGNTIGNKFEDIAQIISLVEDKSRIGVCIDTCHIFAAGYDIRTQASYERTMQEFENVIGFRYLRAVHVNDSKAALGSGKDRHENIGKGMIGVDAFRCLLNDPRFRDIPMVLETPVVENLGEHETYKTELELLRSLIKT